MDWTDSKSSNVAAYAYDQAQQRLHVRFRNGTLGHYENVPPKLHQEFAGAESHGKFIHGRLKAQDKHPWVRAQ